MAGLLLQPVTLGVLLGLVAGKQLGIMLFSWLTVRIGAAELPKELRWRHIYGLSWLAGIGFTMALFINEFAFVAQETGPTVAGYHEQATLGTFLASIIAGSVGYWILRAAAPAREHTSG